MLLLQTRQIKMMIGKGQVAFLGEVIQEGLLEDGIYVEI